MSLDFEDQIVELENRIEELIKLNAAPDVQFDTEIAELKKKVQQLIKETYGNLSPWQVVHVARHQDRPHFEDYIEGMSSEFIELHGDRCYGDDRAMICGFATIDGQKVMLIGMSKGRTTNEKIANNFGMANPEGYRKALRLMRLAERYNIPIVCLIDTPAAYPGKEAEERGQAEAIARNLTEMASIETPIIVVITGEGGSGGALGIAVGDIVMMLSFAIYSVIPPEGCAAILWRDSEKAPDAAKALKITAKELLELGVIDEIINEPPGGAHRNKETTILAVKEAILRHLKTLEHVGRKKLVNKRFEKFVKLGKFDDRKYSSH
ncbi:MAG: acetyl-CoA carboxylase carboxyltransferase subunit alpha [Lentisphaerae bacterium]|nr:acetyl-CoA carboxylase carboxyltransferase subunit alpha [Lentisphaerota bacterium]